MWIRLSGTRDGRRVLGLGGMDIRRDKGRDGLSPGGHEADSEESGDVDKSWAGSGDPP